MSSIFLSHSSQDNAIAEQLKARLEQWGHRSVFLDFDPEDGIPAGRDWEMELYAKLRECRAVIVLCSHVSMASRWCFAEVTHAKALGKEVFPIKLDNAQVDRVLTSVQVIDATAGWDQAYQRLEKGLLAAGLDPKGMFDWDGTRPPYPGLPAFQEEDAAIFFGRDKEIREGQALLNRLRQFGGPRLTLMLGASGSGKSSLMRAGLLPRLKRDPRWIMVGPFRPLTAPFGELATALHRRFSPSRDVQDRIRWNEQDPKPSVDAFLELLKELREQAGSREATTLLMIDQCEELLTGGANEEGNRFLAFLRAVLDREDKHFLVLVTLRSDFLGSFQDYRSMRGLRVETFPVPQMQMDDFASVIEGPAKIAGLDLGLGLVQAMISDTKTSDALPLLAFALRELWEGFGQDKLLTLEEYRDKDKLGGLDECIARAAEAVLGAKKLSENELSDLRNGFLSMVRVNDRGQHAKQPVLWNDLPASSHDVLERFVTARLLISGGDEKGRTLEVAHEALLRSWPKLKGWIDESGEALREIDHAEEEARRWQQGGDNPQELWLGSRAKKVLGTIERLGKHPSPELQRFLRPQEVLIAKLDHDQLSHQDRFLIGQKLAEFGDPRPGVGLRLDGLPDIVWIDIPGGSITLEEIDHVFEVKPFRIAKYLVTNAQFEAFLNAKDGYGNDQWWKDIKQNNQADHPRWLEANVPRETVSWYEAVAFCRWLSAKSGTSIRLPTEWEWQQAATGGNPQHEFPWEGEWDGSRCNSYESLLGRTTAVGMYPAGVSTQGIHDMVGNVSEWCLNKHENLKQPETVHIDNKGGLRVLRGGSWGTEPGNLRVSFRFRVSAGNRLNTLGFRLAQDIP